MNFKEGLNKFWQVVWKDDSPKGWVLSIIFLFVVIKFIFFPILNLITGTHLPLAIVESCSMYHQGNLISNFDEWWERHEDKYSATEIKQEDFKNFDFKNGFNKGDILFIIGKDPKKLKIGDVIVFQTSQATPIIHRIIEIEERESGKRFSTIGDNNNGQLTIEKDIREEQIIGKAVFKLAPYFGWVKLVLFEPLRPASERGLCKEN